MKSLSQVWLRVKSAGSNAAAGHVGHAAAAATTPRPMGGGGRSSSSPCVAAGATAASPVGRTSLQEDIVLDVVEVGTPQTTPPRLVNLAEEPVSPRPHTSSSILRYQFDPSRHGMVHPGASSASRPQHRSAQPLLSSRRRDPSTYVIGSEDSSKATASDPRSFDDATSADSSSSRGLLAADSILGELQAMASSQPRGPKSAPSDSLTERIVSFGAVLQAATHAS